MNAKSFRLLYYFKTIVECRSLTKAADKLNVSTPVVSQSLSELESFIGHTLITRQRGKKIALTRSGKDLYDPARNMVEAGTHAMNLLKLSADKISGNLSISMSTELCTSWFPRLYHHLREQHPKLNIRVDATDDVIALENSDNEIAIRATYTMDTRPNDSIFHLAALPLSLVAAPNLTIESKKPFRQVLKTLPFIKLVHSKQSDSLTAKNLKTNKQELLEINPVFHVNSGIIARDLAEQGFGAALVLSDSVNSRISSGSLVNIGKNYYFGEVLISLVFRDPMPSPQANAFFDLTRNIMSTFENKA